MIKNLAHSAVVWLVLAIIYYLSLLHDLSICTTAFCNKVMLFLIGSRRIKSESPVFVYDCSKVFSDTKVT